MFEIASHTLLIASLPVATAGLIAGLRHRVHTADELENQLDPMLQDALCGLASSPGWARKGDDAAWATIKRLGGRGHLLAQARLMLALTIERAKDGDRDVLVMEAHMQSLASLLRSGWKMLLMPQTNAHLSVDIYTDMCLLWEHRELENNGSL